MTFHGSLPRNQVPEWSSAYINYKGLKKYIKAAAESAKAGKKVDLAGTYRNSQPPVAPLTPPRILLLARQKPRGRRRILQ